jgi:molybdopterin converting factor small subunit
MITVRLFGMTKSLADNQSSLTLALGKNQSVRNVIELVNKRYPKIGELIYQKKILVSVNQEIAHDDTKVQEGDEVALLPPFAGGTPAGRLQSDRGENVRRGGWVSSGEARRGVLGWAGENKREVE